jgi:hypothetical protein
MKIRHPRAAHGIAGPGLIAVLFALAGCSGLQTYPNNLDKNLQVRTQVQSGSAFSKVRASMSIYEVNAQCQVQYEGTVNLEELSVPVGIPAGRWSYLVFDFSSSGFLSNTSTSTASGALLNPQAGTRYDIDVSYLDDIYNVTIRSVAGDGVVLELPLLGLEACRQA